MPAIPVKMYKINASKKALIDYDDIERIGTLNWFLNPHGYAVRSTQKGGKNRCIQMHRLIMSAPAHLEVDHINGNKLDNRKENLRLCTRINNAKNRGISKRNVLGFKGIHKTKNGKRFVARIGINGRGGRKIYLGTFDTAKEAAYAYENEAKKRHGEFFRSSF